MWNRLFGKRKEELDVVSTLDKLNEALEMLEKKETVLQKKAATEIERARDFSKAKNKRAAIQCLKRKRLYEHQIDQLSVSQLRIHDQMIMLEGAKATTETVEALRSSAGVMKAMQKTINIDDVDKTMDEINEQRDIIEQINLTLATPFGEDVDEDIEDELARLTEDILEKELLEPAYVAPAAPVHVPAPAGRQQARPVPQKQIAEEDAELAALQAEMAL